MMSETPNDDTAPGAITDLEPAAAEVHAELTQSYEVPPLSESAPADETVQAKTAFEPKLCNTNFRIDYNPISPLKTGKLSFREAFIAGSANHSQAMSEAIQNAPKIDAESSEHERRWAAFMIQGQHYTPANAQYADPLSKSSLTWKQNLDSPAGGLAAAVPRFGDAKSDVVSGTRALMRMRSQLGLGTYLNIPCWHSGFWITLKAPTRTELDELFRAIEMTKVSVCNNSYGLALSNSTSYMLRPILELIINNIHDTSVKHADFSFVIERLSSLDISWVVGHLAQLVWRKGYQYAHSCINDMQSCANVITEKIEIGKCAFVANERFSELQRAHMTKRMATSMTIDEVDKYLNDFVWHYGRLVKLESDDGIVSFYLKDPSAGAYMSAGQRWVDRLEASVSKTISQTADMAERNRELNKAANVTEMMEYSHWIDYIDLGDGHKVTDRETIDLILCDLSGNKELVDKFNTAVKTYIDDATVAVIAAPTTKCPVCQKEDIDAGDTFKGLVAIDTLSTFFTLLSQEISGEIALKRSGR